MKLLSLSYEKTIQCYNGYLINIYVFYIEENENDKNIYDDEIYINE